MRFATYVMLMFFLSVGFYLAGFRAEGMSALERLAGQQGTYAGTSGFVSPDTTLTKLTGSTAKPDATVSQIIPTIGAALVVGGLLAISGFAAIYILAAVMLVVFLNLFIFPTSYIFTPDLMTNGFGETFSLPIKVFFNILLVLAVLSFVRGGN